jgi:hypothetical protein
MANVKRKTPVAGRFTDTTQDKIDRAVQEALTKEAVVTNNRLKKLSVDLTLATAQVLQENYEWTKEQAGVLAEQILRRANANRKRDIEEAKEKAEKGGA